MIRQILAAPGVSRPTKALLLAGVVLSALLVAVVVVGVLFGFAHLVGLS